MSSARSSLVIARFRPDRPKGGGALRNWQNIRALARLGPVDVLSVGGSEDVGPVDGVRDWVHFSLSDLIGTPSLLRRMRAKLWRFRPGLHPAVAQYRHPTVVRWLRARLVEKRYDVAVIEEIWLARFLRDLQGSRTHVIFDATNVESALRADTSRAQRASCRRARMSPAIDALLTRRLAQEERSVILGADRVWACSDVDVRVIAESYGRHTGVDVVPNGVDVESYQSADAPPTDGDWSAHRVTLLYPGTFSYYPNEDAARRLIEEVLPALRARGCDAKIVLVGRDPAPAMLAAARVDSAIVVTGAVESVVPFLTERCVITLPIAVGSGTRLKVVEGFAALRPVVSTAKGAEGIEGVDGQHFLLREDPGSIAEGVLALWSDGPRRTRLCAAALELVTARYSCDYASRLIQRSVMCLGPSALR